MRRATQPIFLFVAANSLACAMTPDPAPVPVRAGASARPPFVVLRDDWRATVILERTDSVVLTLPTGSQQLQRYERRARFALTVAPGGIVAVRLDSIVTRPINPTVRSARGTVWTGHLTESRIEKVIPSTGSGGPTDLTAAVQSFFPRLPRGGIRAGMTWSDTSNSPSRVDIFAVEERRVSRWTSGNTEQRGGAILLPVRVREDFEQVGRGNQGGREASMTSQGRSIVTYYLTLDGRIDRMVREDSAAVLVSVPSARQIVPTMRFARTTMQFIPELRGEIH